MVDAVEEPLPVVSQTHLNRTTWEGGGGQFVVLDLFICRFKFFTSIEQSQFTHLTRLLVHLVPVFENVRRGFLGHDVVWQRQLPVLSRLPAEVREHFTRFQVQ